jgi:uncharacterized RDD family membrane protein YckC
MSGNVRTNVLLIQTPEGISFPLVLAGPITRMLAVIIDYLCITIAIFILRSIVLMIVPISADLAGSAFYIAVFLLMIGYPIFTEWRWRGQTIGKRLLRLRVMDAQGLKLQFSQVAVRNLLRFIDSLPVFYIVGGLACLLSRRFQRLGDFAANTIVVRNPQVIQPDLGQLMAGKYNSFKDYPHLAARLRQRISPQEAGIALEGILRRDELDPDARIELFAEIAAHVKGIVDFPPEALEGLTDEQYVRNVVDIVFSPQRHVQ